jgi:hypothetical protein
VQGGALSALVGFAFLVILTAVANRRDRKLLGKSHIEEARQVVAELLTKATADPQTSTTSQGVRIAASRLPSEGASTSPIHSVSFSLARSHNDAAMLHRVAREVYPAEYLLRVLPNSGPLVMVSVPPAEPATSTQSEAQHASPKAPPARQASNGKSQLRAYFAPPVEPH